MGFPKRKRFKYALNSNLIDKHLKNRNSLLWSSNSSGEKIFIKNMDTNYIKNAINRVKKDHDIDRLKLIEDLKIELIYRELINEKIKY